MRRAMAEAEVGDDVFGDDPTVIKLQEDVAKLLNKEAALFVPTGSITYKENGPVYVVMYYGDIHVIHATMHEQYLLSGTMGNLVCLMSHCWGRGVEVIMGDQCHIHNYEQGGIAQV